MAPNATSGTLTLTVAQPAPSWATAARPTATTSRPSRACPSVTTRGECGPGRPERHQPREPVLPLTSLTAGTTPSGVTNYSVQNVNLAAGTAQICGTDTNTVASAPATMAPVATNSGGSATDSIPLWSQNECTWTSSGATVTMFDSNQDLEQAGTQSAFGQPITNGEVAGTTKNYPTCTGGVGVSASGGLGDAWTINTANPLPTPTDTNPSAAPGDLPSSNLDLTSASSGSVGGCYGSGQHPGLDQHRRLRFRIDGIDDGAQLLGERWGLRLRNPGVELGRGATPTRRRCTDHRQCGLPPDQADVNAVYVNCSITVSSGNDENGSTNYSTMDLFFNGQPVPQTPTATLSTSSAQPGATVSVTGGTNWWGANGGAPNAGPYGDFQNDSSNFYPVSAPRVYIGTSRARRCP